MKHGIQDNVTWEKERPQAELVPLLQQSNALVLFSRHETFGCVVIEANACGIPALVSNVPVFYETVKDGFNGIIAKGSSAADLCEVLETFVQKKATFNPKAISRHTADKYNYHTAGRIFEAWYAGAQNAYLPANK
jgi:glycosyltransferase involved in cell wall biosynthesis